MKRLCLNFICKNESHVILRMLESSKSINDLIVAVDTGSTDNTIELIKKFGTDNNIPTYVFERPFDNFGNSRNFAMDKLRDLCKTLEWKLEETFGYWYDCDEQLVISNKFDKQKLDKDLYMLNAHIGVMEYTRNTVFRLSAGVKFIGPVHEYISPTAPNLSSGLIEGLDVNVSMDGGSWKEGNIQKKYRDHATVLENYINNEDRDPRWVFYTAQSYHDSANVPGNMAENNERLRRSAKYYKERIENPGGYHEERYYAQYRLGIIYKVLDRPWLETQSELMKAYSMDPLRGESIKVIIDHYQQMGDWNMAYMYSLFCLHTFHNQSPYPKRLLFVDSALYVWKFLETHATSCFYTGRIKEGKDCFKQLINIIEKNPTQFSEQDKQRIEMNSRHFMSDNMQPA